MIPVQFHFEAETELGEAVSFYESRHTGLGIALAAEVQKSIGVIRSYPDGGSPLGGKLRRVIVKRFPYSVIYRRGEQVIYVLAVAHHRQRPGYWKSRQSAR